MPIRYVFRRMEEEAFFRQLVTFTYGEYNREKEEREREDSEGHSLSLSLVPSPSLFSFSGLFLLYPSRVLGPLAFYFPRVLWEETEKAGMFVKFWPFQL